jgi:hypothetical protein
MATETLDATGIRIDLIDTTDRERFGHPSWVVPMGGGRVEDGGIVVEVRPNVEMATERWRGYEEIEALADMVEANGGFMWQGDEITVGDEFVVGRDALRLLTTITVGDEFVVGRDALRLLTTMWKRAEERGADRDAVTAARRQGEQAARRQVREELKTVAAEA